MPTIPVRQVMTTDVLTFFPGESVAEAMQKLVDRGVDAGPVVDGLGRPVGMLSTSDLIVRKSKIHMPTVITILGATLEWPSEKKQFDEDIEKKLGGTVDEVMGKDPVTCSPDDSVEDAATIMHDSDVSRIPVVEDGKLVGIIARGDVLRAIVESR